jgi:drug/metabolite transporter (DMT)-like permease
VLGPFVHGAKFKWMELILGGFIVAGLAIIFEFEPEYHLGIVLSLCAALFASLFSLFNANFTKHDKASTIAFYEMVGGFVGVSAYLLFQDGHPWPTSTPTIHEVGLILLLGTVATAFAFIKSIEIVKILHPFTCSITINLEPIYSILMALWLYGSSEYMSGQFYIGASLLIVSLFIEAFYRRKE